MLLKEKRIYVADDDENVCEAIATILEDEGATVIKGKNGDRLFAAVAFGKPDLIITDLYMPESDGFDAIDHIKTYLEETCPILVITGHATEENIERAEKLGVTECLAKPLKADHLVDAVLQLISVNEANTRISM
jgi:DNA-binding NtrC family response regulator